MSRWTVDHPRPRRRSRWAVHMRRASRLGLLALGLGGMTAALRSLVADPQPHEEPAAAVLEEMAGLQRDLESTQGKVTLLELRLERAQAVIDYSAEYRIPADVSGAIYDAALSEGLHPSLGFQLVKVESGFRHRAVSPKGAIGFAQVRLPTARFYEPDITEERLKEPEVNLRIGFRFLKDLMKRFDGDLRVALLAYNRGPTRVAEILAVGEDPANGYSKAVLSGMRKK